MTQQLVVNVTPFETRVAVIENGQVVEIMLERKAERGLVGNIYLGRVQRVLPGMQAAFVELGLDKAAFLYVGDVLPPEIVDDPEPQLEVLEEIESGGESSRPKTYDLPFEKKRRSKLRIEDLLKSGQELLVQVIKEPISTKGPRVTCNLSIPGRHIVFMPRYDHVGVSRKISDDAERDRLKSIMQEKKPQGGGFVARTVSQGVPDDKLRSDCSFLVSLWEDIQLRAKQLPAPCLIQPELDLVLKCARDMTGEQFERMVIDDADAFERTKRFFGLLDQHLVDKIDLYPGSNPIFEHYAVETEIVRAMSRKVWLRSGGYLVIDQAEALTVVDVNTGKFVGKRNFDETILRTNLEAVREIAFQLRLRNIGGMVIIDFIDMENQPDRDKVLNSLLDVLRRDRAKCNVVRMSELGLVEMTRQRTRESIEQQLCEACFYCDGKGTLKSRLTVAYEIFRALLLRTHLFHEPMLVVHAHPEVVDLIYADEAETLSAIEAKIGKQIAVRPRGSFHQEQFDIFGSRTLPDAKSSATT